VISHGPLELGLSTIDEEHAQNYNEFIVDQTALVIPRTSGVVKPSSNPTYLCVYCLQLLLMENAKPITKDADFLLQACK
jgi:hypothetical protein